MTEQIFLLLGLFGLFWWLAFIALQPFGVVTQDEAGDHVPGTPPSAPVRPRLLRKAWQATLCAALGVIAVVLAARWGILPEEILNP